MVAVVSPGANARQVLGGMLDGILWALCEDLLARGIDVAAGIGQDTLRWVVGIFIKEKIHPGNPGAGARAKGFI